MNPGRLPYLHRSHNMGIYSASKTMARRLAQEARGARYRLSGRLPAAVTAARGLRVLVYHGVVPGEPFRFNSRFITCDLFEQHLRLIGDHCNVLTFDDFAANRMSDGKLNILITFDDGYRNNLDFALPLLALHGLPAVFFVTAQTDANWLFNDVVDVFPHIGPPVVNLDGHRFEKRRYGAHHRYFHGNGKQLAVFFQGAGALQRKKVVEEVLAITPAQEFRNFSDYLDLLTPAQLRTLAASPGIAVGGHGFSHADLSLLPEPELRHELRVCRLAVGEHTGLECNALAFPYGKYNQDVVRCAVDAGFRYLFGTERVNDVPGAEIVQRLTINPFVSAVNELYYISKGTHG